MAFILKANYLFRRAQEVGLVSRMRLPRYINPHFVSIVGTMIRDLSIISFVSLTINRYLGCGAVLDAQSERSILAERYK